MQHPPSVQEPASENPDWRHKKRQAQHMAHHLALGIFLLLFGALALLKQQDLLYIGPLWHFAPLVLVALGMAKMLAQPTPGRLADGLFMICIGVWLSACLMRYAGLSFANSWPVVLIAVGAKMLIQALAGFFTNKD
ncbi:hypothetical protein V8J88_13025 [Massilia sp. W12]|uniref:LiaF transmembrane domain-containing protein n=1 Tax=Massilia sp. W12 TaxID=3126507 RepID=UPI0030CC1D27